MPINSSSIPALRVARAVRKRRRAEGGGIFDWSNVGSGQPDTTNSPVEIPDPLLSMGKSIAWDMPKRMIDSAKQNPGPGLRREDYTDIPDDGRFGGGQPVEPMVGASLETSVNLAGMHAPFVQPGTAGVFGGKLAQTADHAALARAEEMTATGAAPEQIWKDTGWFKGPDDQWRFEINDASSGYKRIHAPGTIDNYRINIPHQTEMGQAYQHPDLYAAYPDLERMPLNFRDLGGPNVRGEYSHNPPSPGDLIPPHEAIAINPPDSRYGDYMKDTRSTTLHEQQHAVQTREGFVPGGNPGEMRELVQATTDARLLQNQIMAGFSPEEVKAAFTKEFGRAPHPAAEKIATDLGPEDLARIATDPHEAYRRLHGEVEARNVQARRDMTPEQRRETPPWTTEDVPADLQTLGRGRRGRSAADDFGPVETVPVDSLRPRPENTAMIEKMKRQAEEGQAAFEAAYPGEKYGRQPGDARFKVDEIRERIRSGDKLPPLAVGHDGLIIDGENRWNAYRAEGVNSIPVRRPNGPRTSAEAATAEPAAAPDAGQVGPGGGGEAGVRGLPEAQAAAARWAGERTPLEGLTGPLKIGGEHFVPGPIGKVHDVAEDYMRTHRPEVAYSPPTKAHAIDPEHSAAIAKAYEEMPHTPNDPATQASYNALIDETAAQYQAIKKTGLKIEPIPPGMPDPYATNPRLAARDVAENNHLWFFPTEGGFGTVNKITDNPMLRKTGEKIGDHELLANDMFRVVHDYFGHLKEGHGFRAAGEDNAWRGHSAMYSDLARPAMTTETRGQNSWVNYGPHGEKNRSASGADTVYADQKVGLMPTWTMYDKGQSPLEVFHGSPHPGFDKFSNRKIGEGEGNQAFGQGLYFAGHEPVSERYRQVLSVTHDPLLKKYKLDDVGHVIGNHFADAGGDPAKLAHEYRLLRQNLIDGGATDKATKNAIVDYDRRIKYLMDPERAKGSMYRVAFEASPEHLLDYDAMLPNQSPYVQERVGPPMKESVKRQIEAIKTQLAMPRRPLLPGNRAALEGRLLSLEQVGENSLRGSEIYKRMGLPARDESEAYVRATNRLMELKIPGMRYRDQGSRAISTRNNGLAVGDGPTTPAPTHNYVVFDDNMLRILKRYGVAGIPAAGVAAAGYDGSDGYAKGGRVARRIRKAAGGAFGTMSPAEDAEADEPASVGILRGLYRGLGETAKGAFESSEALRRGEPENYDPRPIFDAATMPMGTGAVAGVRAGLGEAVLGSGPVRRIPDEIGSSAAPAGRSRQYAQPELNLSGNPIINMGHENPPNPAVQTVADPYRMMFPGVYGNPREIAEQAAARVGPEDPAMKQLFGVTRGDLRDMAQGRVGNEEPNLRLAKNPKGSLSAQNIQTPANTQRLQDILGEAGKHEGLRTADAWYIMDPVYKRMVDLHGPEAAERYRKFNTTTAMASPGSDVMTEIQRGTAAHWLNEQGRFNDFVKFGGIPGEFRARTPNYPKDMRYIEGHPYHRTAQAGPMQKYVDTGAIQSDAPKVPLYAHASGVPETGFQTSGPVGDAHFSRGVGLSDTRKGPTDVQGSFSRAEYQTLQPWWQHEVAGPVGLESVPAQARLWTTLGPQTGVDSALGAPKLELLAQQIMQTAKRLYISPEKARDLVLSGKAGAGVLAGATIAPAVMDQTRERKAGGAVNAALKVARNIRRAKGGAVHIGPIVGNTDGRADKVPMHVPDGSYVLTADHCSALGEGNTLSGFEKLKKMFPKSVAAYKAAAKADPVKRASGGRVPILAADGEFVICPDDIKERFGDLDEGHRILDHWQTTERKKHIETLAKLAPPAQD